MVDERMKQVGLRLCGMAFASHREYCIYRRSSLYKRDWEAARSGRLPTTMPGEEPEDVKLAINRRPR